MYELIKSSLQAYAFAAVFSGLWILLVVYGMFKKTKKIEKSLDKLDALSYNDYNCAYAYSQEWGCSVLIQNSPLQALHECS